MALAIPPNRHTQIRQLVETDLDGERPDAIFIFSSSIIKDEGRGHYRTLSYSDLGEHGLVTGSRTRVIAGAKIAEAIPGVPIVTNSFNRFNTDEPTMASVFKKELIARNVDPSRFMSEEKSFSTITQIIEMVKMAAEQGWTKLAVVGNDWHFPRVREMYQQLGDIVSYEDPKQNAHFQAALKQYRGSGALVSFVDAEAIMRVIHPLYGDYHEAVAKMPAFRKNLEIEAKGLHDLRSGRYRVTLKPEKPRE